MMRTTLITALTLVLLAPLAGAQPDDASESARRDAADSQPAVETDNGESAERAPSASAKEFKPSERIRAGEAVAFPADI